MMDTKGSGGTVQGMNRPSQRQGFQKKSPRSAKLLGHVDLSSGMPRKGPGPGGPQGWAGVGVQRTPDEAPDAGHRSAAVACG